MSMVETAHDRVGLLADRPGLRWIIYAILIVVLGLLTIFPRSYVARAKIVPQDTSVTAASTTTLLGALGGGANGIGSLLAGGRPSNDLYLIIGRSDSVTDQVIKALGLVGADRQFATVREAKLWLDRKVDIHLLLGGVMEISTKVHDPDQAVRITSTYETAISRQLAGFGRQIIVNKQRIVGARFRDATQRVAKAEGELAAFRRTYNLADPQEQFGSALSQRTALQAQIQTKEVELQTLRDIRGPESVELRQAQAELSNLRSQLARTATPALGLSSISTKYLTLYRDYLFQQGIYAVYQRSSEQVAVEELAAESASYIQIIDPAHLDPDRKFNVWAVGLLGSVILLVLFIEWYGPATGLFTRRGLRRPADRMDPLA